MNTKTITMTMITVSMNMEQGVRGFITSRTTYFYYSPTEIAPLSSHLYYDINTIANTNTNTNAVANMNATVNSNPKHILLLLADRDLPSLYQLFITFLMSRHKIL